LRIIGKGKKLREIPVPDELLKAVADFRLKIGLPSPQPQFKEKTPLIPMQNLIQSICTRRIDQILKWAFNLGANKLEIKQPRKASKLRSASAHWLRHSYVTYLLDSGAPLKVAQENAGHSNIGTTMLYRHVAQEDRFEATRNLSLSKRSRRKISSEIA
jgi:site-specific recombinase XerD